MAFASQADRRLDSKLKVEAFLTKLAKDQVSPSTQNQAFNAVVFFYTHVLKEKLEGIKALRARPRRHIRVAPTVEELRQLLPAVPDLHSYPTNLICRLLYGCGLRVSEALELRVKDIRFTTGQIIIRNSKCNKDRVVNLPEPLRDELTAQLQKAQDTWQRDLATGLPVKLPDQLARKYPHLKTAWEWYWLFPATKPCVDPHTGDAVRWRCHPANVQRAMKQASQQLGLSITPHYLRHAYATHCLSAGANIRDLQDSLGHANLNTTMEYLTPASGGVVSPLIRLVA